MDRTSVSVHQDAKIAPIQVVGLSALLGGSAMSRNGYLAKYRIPIDQADCSPAGYDIRIWLCNEAGMLSAASYSNPEGRFCSNPTVKGMDNEQHTSCVQELSATLRGSNHLSITCFVARWHDYG